MFVLDKNPRFTHSISVTTPVDGGHDTQTFRATFTVLGDTELATFDLNDRVGTQAFLQRAFVGFDDITGADEQAVPFSDQARDALIDMPYVRVALVKGYFAGVYKGQLGN